MTHLRRQVGFATAVLLLVVASGCGGSTADRSPTAAVKGTVTYQGNPLPKGTVLLHPQKGRSASGKVVDGQIVEVTTYETGDGAVLGEHRVSIQSVETDSKDSTMSKSLIPVRYGNPETSMITTKIEADKTNELTIELKD